MRFMTKLVLFAVCLTAVLGAYRAVEKVRDRDEDHMVVDADVDVDADADAADEADAHAVVAVPHPPAAPAERGAKAVVRRVEAVPGEVRVDPREVRIVTENRTTFMSLRDDRIVAGMTDSLRKHIDAEMKREVARETSGVGATIAQSVVSGVNKLLEHEISIPVSEVRDIDYVGRRIVIRYRRGQPRGLNLESIKTDGDRTILEQFSEEDARRFVEAVKVRIK